MPVSPVLWILAVCLILFPSYDSEAQPVRISELMADNVSIFPDNHDFDDYSDWIEIENVTDESVVLDDYFLSDSEGDLMKWRFPDGTVLPPSGFLVLRADGFNAGFGETHRREYSPWGSFKTRRYHTNFKLSSSGESVILSRIPAEEGGSGERMLIPFESVWLYYDLEAAPDPEWMTPGFRDSHWKSGAGKLGYGNGDEGTVIEYGPDAENKYPTAYFRTDFELGAEEQVLSALALGIFDDGAVIYVNGNEVHRVRMSSDEISHDSLATSSASQNQIDPFDIPLDLLRAGKNVIAVEVHQRRRTSSDLSFDLQIYATTISGSPQVVDRVDFNQQVPNVSYGRTPENEWTFFGEPTPGRPNTSPPLTFRGSAAPVQFQPPRGLFTEPVQILLSVDSGAGLEANPEAEIRYSLDGSEPSRQSLLYTEPIEIAATSPVRARVFESGKIPGPIITHTYVISEAKPSIPVVGFNVEPRHFFDPVIGIYSNVHKGREAAISLEFFEPNDGGGSFMVNAGARIGGENIWRFSQKPLNVALRGRYGDDALFWNLFPGRGMGQFDAIGFRNGGDNWPNAMLRDAIAPDIATGQLENEVAWYRPVSLYLNGAYWGLHNMRLRWGDAWFGHQYQIPPGEYDLIVKEHTINGTTYVADEGSLDDWYDFLNWITHFDMSQEGALDQVANKIDMDSFMDYCAMLDFVYESSWHHNQEFWKPKAPGSRWRWTINDIDRGFNISRISSSLIDNLVAQHPVFEALTKNPAFVERFVQRYAAHMSSTFHPDRIQAIVESRAEEVEAELPRHIERWRAKGGIQSLEAYRNELDEIIDFAQRRAAIVFEDIASVLDINNQQLTLNVKFSDDDYSGGRLMINGVPLIPEISNNIVLYRGIPFDLSIEPAPGYAFAGFFLNGEESGSRVSLDADAELEVRFESSGQMPVEQTIASDTVLSKTSSAYVSTGDIFIPSGVSLTLEPGVVLAMPAGASIVIEGHLNLLGTEESPVRIESLHAGENWGALVFRNASGTSTLRHFELNDATHFRGDPVSMKAAISSLDSHLVLEYGVIVAPFPVFARGGKVEMRHCRIHPTFTGDGINIKFGEGVVEDSIFTGNTAPDTDAIDFDGVVNGRIARNRIYGFRGTNSDGIDVGEQCTNLIIEGNRIYGSSDKGVSVGQASTTTITRNLIVHCDMGIAIKDFHSNAQILNNTLVANRLAVAVYEKNFGKGGGAVKVAQTIFSQSEENDLSVDSYSTGLVSWSLSDTAAIPGTGNIEGDPDFADPSRYDFSLMAGSPAMDQGDPMSPSDPDGSRADIGAYYHFHPDDYPFTVPRSIVINEILSHSNSDKGDWIELFNSSGHDVDLSGWFISDSQSNLTKFQIPAGTVVPPSGYVVFNQVDHFGIGAQDPGNQSGFGFSEFGESAYLYKPGDGLVLDYLEKESFGPSAPDVSRGRYFKTSTRTWDFVAMANQTPGKPNALPRVGPVVISEIMYHPVHGEAEFLELLNISDDPVSLFDPAAHSGWRITSGIDLEFPVDQPVSIAPGERLVLVKNLTTFLESYPQPINSRILRWNSGSLNNGGERIELSSPGDIPPGGTRQFIREDRINYHDLFPWPELPDLGMHSLTRIDNHAYGNDPINWMAAVPTPGYAGVDQWAEGHGVKSLNLDSDSDGISNLQEYFFGTDPQSKNRFPVTMENHLGQLRLVFPAVDDPRLSFSLHSASSLDATEWHPVDGHQVFIVPMGSGMQNVQVIVGPIKRDVTFYRLQISSEDHI